MILLLIIISTIQGVSAMKSEFSSSDTEYSEFVVSIWYYHEHRCTGSILHEKHVLTSGNCVAYLPVSSLSVAAGITESTTRDLQLIRVEKIYFHPEFHKTCFAHHHHYENNIAVLELSETLRWEMTIAVVPLIDVEYNWNSCNECQVFGWHGNTLGGVKLLRLRWSSLIIADDERCNDLNVTLWKNEKCFDNPFKNVLEEEDYGAPVICEGLAVGIIVHTGAGNESPSVLLSVYPYLDFIASILLPFKINVPGKFAFYVALFHNGIYRCGGSIIDSTHIVTAAHCVVDCTRRTIVVLPSHSEFSVNDLRGDDFALVDHIQKHPNYVNYMLDTGAMVLEYDIAVLKLRAPLTWNTNVKAIRFAHSETAGHLCQIYRWSQTITKEGKISMRSLSSPAVMRDYAACRDINRFRQSSVFCLMNMYSLPTSTRGDSGSPLICDGVIVGVLSTHTLLKRLSWGPYQEVYYTAIHPHIKFINDAVAGRIF